jgi:hypothetical protein
MSLWLQIKRGRWRPEACSKDKQRLLSTEAPGSRRAHVSRHLQALGRAHLRALRCSSRSGRSSEPGCEVRTYPQDGQGAALSSAPPHG